MLAILLSVVVSAFPALFGPLAPDETPTATSSPTADRIDQILTRLEQRNESLRDIQCRIEFIEKDDVDLSKRQKWGTVRYMSSDPNPLFMIHFERGQDNNVLLKQEWYLFDGRFLSDAVERRKHVTKREIVRPGEKRDFFDLEKTPFPMPFGQKKASILKHFNITLANEEPTDPSHTDHLICVPKETSRLYRKYDRLDMFIHREVHLPTRIVVVKNKGYETQTANFPDLSMDSINTGLANVDFMAPKAWSGYEEDVEMLDTSPAPMP